MVAHIFTGLIDFDAKTNVGNEDSRLERDLLLCRSANEHENSLKNLSGRSDVGRYGFMVLGSAGKTKNYKPFKGFIAELLVFNRALTFLERVQYETYLAVKYGTGLRGGNFVSSGEKVLWHVSKNAASMSDNNLDRSSNRTWDATK